MKLPILLPVIAVCTFAQVEHGFGAIMAEWHTFNTSTATFPVSASSSDSSITSAAIDDPVNLTKNNDATHFSISGWNTGSTVDTTEYFQASLAIDPGFTVSFLNLQYYAKIGGGGVSLTIHVRSDANGDNFATDLSSSPLSFSSNQLFTTDLSSLANQSGTVNFRFYGTSATAAGTSFLALNNGSVPGGGFLAINGTATPVPEPSFYAGASGLALLAFALWRRHSRSQLMQS